ncbi:MAG: murein L,D-transpeptidase catalytic domain family protein, partial [Dinghuibacter sp.]|nr:murein L,D-transpeptidase catalytic domain family protein [Dinghuibacter sp.]
MKKILAGTVLAVFGLTATAIVYREKNYPASREKAKPSASNHSKAKHSPAAKENITTVLQNRSAALKSFLQKGGYNEEVCFFVNMSIASGKERFFVYDMKKGTIRSSGLVTHGSGGNSTFEQPDYSNQTGSNCTSLGR